MQRICIIFFLTLICHKTLQQDGGRNDGEPDYDPEGFLVDLREEEYINGEPNLAHRTLLNFTDDTGDEEEDELEEIDTRTYLMLMPEDIEDSSNIEIRGGNDDNDMIQIPDSVWDAERNRSNANITLRQSSPPSTACLNIRLIYNRAWVQSSAGGNSAVARQRALAVLAEAQNIYNNKFSSSNRLGTRISFNLVGGAPAYDSSGSYYATGSSLSSSAVRRWISTSSYSTEHYAFLTGNNGGGAIGVAYVGTACLRLSNDQRYKTSINEWYNDVAQSGSVLAHEIGHALGMSHDFGNGGPSDIRYDSSGRRCTGINGLMDYGARTRVNRFTTCSREDFARWYRRVLQTFGSFCLTCAQTPPTGQCNGVPSTDWSCCSPSSQCNVGGGDCDSDSDCAGSLRCGSNNCRRDYSSSRSNWHRSADCCIGQSTVTTQSPPTGRCNGVPSTDWSCCSPSSQCNVGGGDCDSDSDCAGSLRCGSNNCRRDYSSSGSNWHRSADCCIGSTGPNPNPPTSACGVKPASIVGGSQATPYSIPWQVGLVRPGSSQPFCGGTLISNRHVMTAAHCTTGSSSRINVMVGEHRITSSADGTRHTICRYVRHPSYGNLNNDFSILHLRTPVQIGTRAAPACLPTTSFGGNFLSGKSLTVSGWGALSEGGGSPTVLYRVNVPGMTNSQCSRFYSGITSSMVCAGRTSGGIDSCQGDSGGPLTYTTGGRTYLVGVVSWGDGCARPNKPGVYARVTSVLSWINGQLSQTC